MSVSEAFAKTARLAEGIPATFQTLNGPLTGTITPAVELSLAPVAATELKIGVGLIAHMPNDALQEQISFLIQFLISKKESFLTKH